jgi:hypothetical protein
MSGKYQKLFDKTESDINPEQDENEIFQETLVCIDSQFFGSERYDCKLKLKKPDFEGKEQLDLTEDNYATLTLEFPNQKICKTFDAADIIGANYQKNILKIAYFEKVLVNKSRFFCCKNMVL